MIQINLLNNRFFERYTTLIGNITFFILSIMAVVFWRERTIMLDAAFQSFCVINKGVLAIQAQRFGAAFVQLFPLITSKLGLPLKWVLISYSMSFIIFHYALFFICNYILKIKQLAFGILIFTILMTVHTFFWAQNEVVQGTSLVFLYFAFLINKNRNTKIEWQDYILLILTLLTTVYFHPLTIFVFTFFIIFFFISTDNIISYKKLKLSIIIWLSILLVKILITRISSYDVGSMERLTNNVKTPLKYLIRGDGVKLFLAHCLDDFAVTILIMFLIVVFYYINNNKKKLLFFFFSCLIYILIVLVSFYDSKDWFYMESQFLPISVIIILPLIFDILPTLNTRLSLTCVSLLIAFKLLYIIHASQFYTKRLQYLNELLEYTYKFENTKFMADDEDIDKNKLLMHWGCAYETPTIPAGQLTGHGRCRRASRRQCHTYGQRRSSRCDTARASAPTR